MKANRWLVIGACISIVLLTGCFQGERSSVEIDPPYQAEAVSDPIEGEGVVAQTDGEESREEDYTETVARELYLIDANGFVASQVIELPSTTSLEVATQVLEYLIVDGPVTEVLPNGFRAVLPAGTEVLGLNLLDDGTMIVDLSEEFSEYIPQDEIKIVEAITHTLTQFENVDRVQLWINGHPLEEMPANGTPIGNGYSQANGINIVHNDTIDFINNEAVTMYYPARHEENRYYIPVTQYVETNDQEIYGSIVSSLINGPSFLMNVMHVFNDGAELVSQPTLVNGVLELTFNEEILLERETMMIADEVIETIVRTLTIQEAIEAVDIKVDSLEQLMNENGEPYSEPVTADFFLASEEL